MSYDVELLEDVAVLLVLAGVFGDLEDELVIEEEDLLGLGEGLSLHTLQDRQHVLGVELFLEVVPEEDAVNQIPPFESEQTLHGLSSRGESQ